MRGILTLLVAAAWLAAVAAAADRPLTLIQTPNLTVLGQQPVRTLRGIALQLEQFRAVIGGLIVNAQRPLPQPTFVYVFGTRKEFEPFIPLYNGKPGSMAGYFQHDEAVNDIALQLEGFEESARIVFHEYTHLLLHNAARSIPIWLDEGLAEYYSTYALDPDGKRAHIGRPIVWHVFLLRERFIPLADLIAVDHRSPLYNERDRQSIFYAEAWALTHYLMTAAPGGPASINAYTTAIAKGARADTAFLEAFGKTPPAFEKELRAYIHGVVFNSRVFTFTSKLAVDGPDAGRTVPAPEASAWLGDLQRRVGRREEAAARIESALAAAPDTAMPQLTMAWLRLDQKRPDEAWAAFERAAALAPDDFSTQFAYGVALLRREADEGRFAGRTLAVERARAALLKATTANPTSSDAFAWLAYAEMLGDRGQREAMAAIRRAIELAPGRLDYLLRYGDILMMSGSFADARTILTDVSRITTDPRSAEEAARRLEVLAENEARMREAAARAAAAAQAAAITAAQQAREHAVPPNDAPSDTVVARLANKPRETEDMGRPKLRAVRNGEERAYGDLVQLECGDAQVRFHLKVGSRVVIAFATRMEDITLSAFVPPADFTVACGKRQPPDAVYLTWRSAPHRAEGAATIVGQAVALEFVPRGYTP